MPGRRHLQNVSAVQVSSVRRDSGDVRRNAGRPTDAILGEDQMPSVGRPILFDGNAELERRQLLWVGDINIGGEKRG